MAEIRKKLLYDNNSNKFLEENGFVNLKNSMDKSSWSYPNLNLIFNIPFDSKFQNIDDLHLLFYNAGFQKAKTGSFSPSIIT